MRTLIVDLIRASLLATAIMKAILIVVMVRAPGKDRLDRSLLVNQVALFADRVIWFLVLTFPIFRSREAWRSWAAIVAWLVIMVLVLVSSVWTTIELVAFIRSRLRAPKEPPANTDV